MTILNRKNEYSPAFKLIHWLMAVGIILMLFAGFFMGDIPKTSDWHEIIKNIHRLAGLFLLFLAFIRVLIRLLSSVPDLPHSTPKIEQLLSKSTHLCLYLLIFMIPLSGWFMTTAVGKISKLPIIAGITLPMPFVPTSISLAKQANQLHELLSWCLIVLVSLHVLAALKHHFIDKDTILKRMLFTK